MVPWHEVPVCFRRKIIGWLVLAGAVFLASVLLFGYGYRSSMSITGFVLGSVIVLIAVYYYIIARTGSYQKITGYIRKVGKDGMLFQNTCIVIETDTGTCARIIVRERQSLFAQGAPITVYLPKGAQESKLIGDPAYREYYAIE